MSYHGPKVKLSRRFGVALTPKAAKVMEKRSDPPGQHGRGRRSREDSDFKKQLIQKQLLRAQYNILEAQMQRYYQMALQSRGNSAERLVQLLESRLDALVLRAGFALTIYAARQYDFDGLLDFVRFTCGSCNTIFDAIFAITSYKRSASSPIPTSFVTVSPIELLILD